MQHVRDKKLSLYVQKRLNMEKLDTIKELISRGETELAIK